MNPEVITINSRYSISTKEWILKQLNANNLKNVQIPTTSIEPDNRKLGKHNHELNGESKFTKEKPISKKQNLHWIEVEQFNKIERRT